MGNVAVIGVPLANLAVLLERSGRYDVAATIMGFVQSPMAAVTVPDLDAVIDRLRKVLGTEEYEMLAVRGRAITRSAMVIYAYDQIDRARAELKRSP